MTKSELMLKRFPGKVLSCISDLASGSEDQELRIGDSLTQRRLIHSWNEFFCGRLHFSVNLI